jgi:adenosylcobinamide-phosphate synthase
MAARCEAVLFALGANGYVGGAIFAVLLISLSIASYLALRSLLGMAHPWLAVMLAVFATYSSVALRDQLDHARPIWEALERGDLDTARSAVQKIVGRDAGQLDAHGVARAAVESVAESFVDGFFAPIFWFATGALSATPLGVDPFAGGALFALVYRTANTLDSMVGYRNERYSKFGMVSARLDDLLNYFPARLVVLPLFVGAISCRLNTRFGFAVWWRDRLTHSSPNSGHAESFFAGALGLKLGGPIVYPDGATDGPWMGNGTTEATPTDIRRSCRLVLAAGLVAFLAVTCLLFCVVL